MSTKRNQIIKTARQLFSEHGFCATGVDAIIAEAGVSKRTMYKYFPTKDQLIDEVVQEYVTDIQSFWSEVRRTGPPREQILSIFSTAQIALGSPGLQGCLTVKAMAEFGGTGLAVESSCQAFKHWEREAFENLAVQFGAKNPATLGLRLTLIYEGMFAYTQVMRTSPPADVIEWVAEILDATLTHNQFTE